MRSFCTRIILVLLALQLVGVYLLKVKHVQSVTLQKIISFVDVGEEASVPTFFSAFLLLAASLLLFAIAYRKKGAFYPPRNQVLAAFGLRVPVSGRG